MAFKFAVELPNAKHDSGLGTNETEFYASLLLKKHLGRIEVLGDAGFAILGSPILEDRQTDPFTYGAATIIPVHKSINLVAEVNGRQGPPRRLGNGPVKSVGISAQLRDSRNTTPNPGSWREPPTNSRVLNEILRQLK
jgi:hypothetical protein